MPGTWTSRLTLELFLSAIGGSSGTVEPWVAERLTAILEQEDVRAGERIFTAGDPPDHLFLVRQGRLELLRDGQHGEIVVAPCALGMSDALAERPRSHTARALVPLQLVRVRVDAWLELLEDSFELTRMAVLRLARGVAALEEKRLASGGESAPVRWIGLDSTDAKLDVIERLAVLMQAVPLRGSGAQPISDLASLCEEVSLDAGKGLFEQDTEGDRVFVLVDGRVEATRESPHAVWRGGPGQVVCGMAAFAGSARNWRAQAVTRVRALVFRVDDWFDILEENFEMVRTTLATLAVEMDRAGGRA